MKILDGMPVSGQPPNGPKAPVKNPQSGPTFSEVLKETVDSSVAGERPTQVASVSPSGPVKPATVQPAATVSEPTIYRIERFIDMMDDYRCKLGDPLCSLKQIQPLLEQMTTEKEKMQLLLEELPDTEPLRDVLNRALVTVSTEETKYYRGDYL